MTATDADRRSPEEQLHHLDARSAFEQLRLHGSLSRGELAELTGRSRIAASTIIEQMRARGVVDQLPGGSGGPASRRFALSSTFCFVVGAEIRHDEVTVAVADISGQISAQITEPYEPDDDASVVLMRIITHCMDRAGAPAHQLRRVVVGSPGVIDPTSGEFAFAYLLPSWKRALTSDLRALLGNVPVVFENDVNLAAMAEARDGAGRGVKNMVFAWLSIGVGIGTVLNGRLHRGRHGWAGEVGFVQAPVPVDHIDTEGISHSIHQLASVGAIESVARRRGLGNDAAKALREATTAGARGEEFLDDVAHRVALVVSTACLVVNPSVVVLGGSYIHAGGADIVERVQRAMTTISPVPARVALAEVGHEPILRGALQAALDDARDQLFAG